jgi:hemerythrin-like domain-containing protein
MKRSDALAPLSRDHHVALEVALRLRRANADDVGLATARFADYWQRAGRRHFEIEEELLLPALPAGGQRWDDAVARVLAEHADIRARAERLAATDVEPARALGELLQAHVRFEERTLFALLERGLPQVALAALGAAVERAERAP